MAALSFDFTGYRVLVVGGTRGAGHAIARSFRDSGGQVTVTGTMMLRELYDVDLAGIDYEMVNLARQDSMDHLVGIIGPLDILVLAAGCSLPYGLPDSERSFIGEAVRSGVLGPMFLTTRLRLKLSQSPAPGGGCVINTGAVARWLELTSDPAGAAAELAASTARAGQNWAGIGVRVNSVLEPARGLLPRQGGPGAHPSAGSGSHALSTGDTLVRAGTTARGPVSSTVMFLATLEASRITGQTIRLS